MNDMLRFFSQWPAAIPRQGIVMTNFNESIPFADYMLCGDSVLLIRGTPDAMGTRRVIVSTRDITAIKILDAIEPARFTAMGFKRHTDSVAAVT